jgi:hypothetical protein
LVCFYSVFIFIRNVDLFLRVQFHHHVKHQSVTSFVQHHFVWWQRWYWHAHRYAKHNVRFGRVMHVFVCLLSLLFFWFSARHNLHLSPFSIANSDAHATLTSVSLLQNSGAVFWSVV